MKGYTQCNGKTIQPGMEVTIFMGNESRPNKVPEMSAYSGKSMIIEKIMHTEYCTQFKGKNAGGWWFNALWAYKKKK